MVRVDARLVHGQVAGRWFRALRPDRVVIIDEECAQDPFLLELFRLASPPEIEILCCNSAEAARRWSRDKFGTGCAILLFRSPASAEEAWRMGVKFSALNVAQVPAGAGRRPVHAAVNLSEPEIDLLLGLVAQGVNVYIQQVPDDSPQPIVSVVKRMRDA